MAASNILQATKLDLNELNRLFREIQSRINELSGAGGPSVITDDLTVEGSLRLRERVQQEVVDLATDGVVWFQPREGQAREAQLQATEETVTAGGIIRRQLDVIQRAAEDGVDVGKASTTSFNHGLDASLDLNTDRVNVAVDEGELDHGLLLASSLLDNDHPLYQRKHGFEVSSAGAALQTLSYDKATQKITLTPTGTTFRFWIDGVQFIKTGAQVSGAHTTTTGMKYFYYDSAGALQTMDAVWSIRDRTVTPVAAVYWNSTLSDGVCFYEAHTADRQLEVHFNLHFSRGCQYISGYDLTGYSPNVDSDAAVTYGIGAGVVADEDIRFASVAVADTGPYVIFSRTGATGVWTWTTTSTFPFPFGTTYPSYNQWTGATWQLTEVAGGGTIQYVNYFVCATTAVTPQAAQAFIIPGQAIYASVAAAGAETLSSLSLGTLPFEEIAGLWRVTVGIRNSYAGTRKCQINAVSSTKSQSVTVTGGVGITDHASLTGRTAADVHPAASITNTPAGGIAAVTVQAALDELDTEKAPKASPTFTGIVTAPQVNIDSTFNLYNPATNEAIVTFDSGVDGLIYYRTLDTFAFLIASAAKFQISSTVITSVLKHIFNNDTSFYFDKDATGPFLTVDSGDFYQYNRTGNTHGFYVGSSRKLGFDANYFLVGPTNPGGFTEAGVASPPAVGATTPAWNCYAKPVAGQWRADTSAALTYTGLAGNAIIWDASQFDYSNGRISLVTIAGVANAGFQVTEAGVYRWSFVSNAEMVAGATYTIYTCRLNSASSGGLVEYMGLGSVKNWNAAATHYHNIAHSGTVLCAANDYIVVSHAGVGNMIDNNWNTFSLERIN